MAQKEPEVVNGAIDLARAQRNDKSIAGIIYAIRNEKDPIDYIDKGDVYYAKLAKSKMRVEPGSGILYRLSKRN